MKLYLIKKKTKQTKKQKWSKFFVLPLCIYWEKIVLGYDHMKFDYFNKTLLNHMSIMMTCVTIYTFKKKKKIYLFSWLEEKETLAADFVKLH